MSRLGTIVTYTIVHSGTEDFKDKTPYVMALIEENRHTMLARVEGYTPDLRIEIGMGVEYMTTDERNNPIYRFVAG